MKKQGVAAFLSALIPGAGQIYNRDWFKGTLFLAGSLILGAELRRNLPMSAFAAGKPLAHSGFYILLVIGLLGLSGWSVIDAYRNDKKSST
ncbi:MAG: hypothetical protein HY200_09000 [Nitrospirae bacterium]|nr:hypothetical protein [Nitrospirota bacterium]MBI3595082.1 hypothetical protein [Nitrospirota bacterium]